MLLSRAVRARGGPVLARMEVDEAIVAARRWGALDTDEQIALNAEAGQRFDPVKLAWITPARETDWNEYWDIWLKSTPKRGVNPKPTLKIDFAAWMQKRAQAAKKKKEEENAMAVASLTPFDLPALRAAANDGVSEEGYGEACRIWGALARFDKLAQAELIAQAVREAGFTVVSVLESQMTSSWTPPVLVKLHHPVIKDVELHPGGGIHGTVRPQGKKQGKVQAGVERVDGNGPPYIRLETKDGKLPLKIRNKSLPEDVNYHARDQHADYVWVKIAPS
ncbi:MAG TPA: hypothetical protein VHZ31_06510 [Solirubrobacteraceae bacterium]|nr:hypothetical protein [Solirubrobacteraceae bacterium]